jgi:ribonuclease HI
VYKACSITKGNGVCSIKIQTYIHWVKAHVGTYGNEVPDKLVKAAARNKAALISYNKISEGTVISEIEEETKQKWQKEWNELQRQL